MGRDWNFFKECPPKVGLDLNGQLTIEEWIYTRKIHQIFIQS